MNRWWSAVKLVLRVAFANAAVVFVTQLIANMGLLRLPREVEMVLGGVLVAFLAWLRRRYGDVLRTATLGRKLWALAVRAAGIPQ